MRIDFPNHEFESSLLQRMIQKGWKALYGADKDDMAAKMNSNITASGGIFEKKLR